MSSGDIYIDFATSDISARGIDQGFYEACQNMSSYQRGVESCGHYRHTRETLFLPQGYNYTGFLVPIINDDCLQSFPRYIQLNLFVPGSAALKGEYSMARIRIDDDDFDGPLCNQ